MLRKNFRFLAAMLSALMALTLGSSCAPQEGTASPTAVAATEAVATASPTPAAETEPATPQVSIMEIQGASHISPWLGQSVVTSGVVTAVGADGFYVQDPVGDGDEATSDAMYVFMGASCDGCPSVRDFVEMTDRVSEVILGGAGTGNLSTTQMGSPEITVLSSGNELPAPVVVGANGRVPPNVDVISADELPADLQSEAGAFDPTNDGIDFFESLEGMLVIVESPVAVSATRVFNSSSSEFFTLPSSGQLIAPPDARTNRGGISLQAHPDNKGDQNPERVQIQFDASPQRPGIFFPSTAPAVAVGDQLGDITGVVGYSFGNFEVQALSEFSVTASGLEPESSLLGEQNAAVTVASYNVLNLSPLPEDNVQRAALAAQIVTNLGSPDVIALQEIQDNSGGRDDGQTDASQTLQALVDAISSVGGPNYVFLDVAPQNNSSGGVPGGNIRNAFLYNPARVTLQDFFSLTPEILSAAGVGNSAAFTASRDPLAASFLFSGEAFTIINNHLTSRFGSSPVFGGVQPFVQAGESQREAQLQALNEYVDFLLAADDQARIIVLGDLNTFEFTNDLLEILPGTLDEAAILQSLLDTVEDDNRYTFNFEGNSQMLDHIFVTPNLLDGAHLDIVHVNVDFPRLDDSVASDHEPLLASFVLD